MIIGLVPGAMKPYHAGHHFLVKKAMAECNKVIIFTTVKDRKGISGKKMKEAWNKIIMPNLPKEVEIEFVISPVGSVYKIIEWEEEAKTNRKYRIYGGSEDSKRYNTEYIKRKWPIAGYRFTNVAEEEANRYMRGVGQSPMAKGEWVRNAIKEGNITQFRAFLPEIVVGQSEEYLKILTD